MDEGPAGGGAVQDFTDLRVWQASMALCESVYALTASFPSHETYGLTAQIRRAVVSIPSNIAEGFGRGHLREYVHHLAIARGSLAEVRTQLELARRFKYTTSQGIEVAIGEALLVGRQLTALRNALMRKLDHAEKPVT